MSDCTAPRRGHRSAAARERCPACRNKSYRPLPSCASPPKSPRPARQPVSREVQQRRSATGSAGGGSLPWWYFALFFRDWDPWVVASAVLAVIVPLCAAAALTRTCGALLPDGDRCKRTRPGVFVRCQDHSDRTATGAAATLCVVIAVVNFILIIAHVC